MEGEVLVYRLLWERRKTLDARHVRNLVGPSRLSVRGLIHLSTRLGARANVALAKY